MRAFQRWEQYDRGSSIRAWIFTMLYHAVVSRKRWVDAREVQPLEDEEGRPLFEPAGEADPDGTFYDSFIDATLGVPEGTIKSRLFHGRRLLQAQLQDYAELMGYLRPAAATAAPWRGCRRCAYRTSGACVSV